MPRHKKAAYTDALSILPSLSDLPALVVPYFKLVISLLVWSFEVMEADN